MKELNLEEINGNEIIDFLNKETTRDSDKLCDIGMSSGSFVFEGQELKDGTYKLYFTASYNNWGTDQDIPGNSLNITKKEIWFSLDEPFDGDGTSETLEEVIKNWIYNHKFDNAYEEKFYALIKDAYEQLPNISVGSNKEIQQVIDTLIKAQTYIK
ncbi:MAG: hypothetical protein KA007_00035 [Candidatus Pacebacteria bacterium]|nr:hypothetical protein [Candidatus Paceibacterota bacterium]